MEWWIRFGTSPDGPNLSGEFVTTSSWPSRSRPSSPELVEETSHWTVGPSASWEDWRAPVGSRWALQDIEWFLPTHTVRCDPARTRSIPRAPEDLADLPVPGSSRGDVTLAAVLDFTATDAWLVMRDGVIVDEQYRAGMSAGSSHLLLSVTKSVVGTVAGILADRGLFATSDLVTRYCPELGESGYQGATIRDVLDMRSGVRFDEAYADPASDVRRLEKAIRWQPGMEHEPPGLHRFLGGLSAARPHGGRFEYRSCETDVLGWVCERASGALMPELISELIWRPMGAEHDASLLCDTFGATIHDGGLSGSLRDVARFGQLVLDAGRVAGHQIAPRGWFADIWSVDGQVRQAFATSPAEDSMPGGWYRNQFWVTPGRHGDLLLCMGIFGQLIRVDPATRTVMVKLSSWGSPQDPACLFDTLLACDAVATALSGRTGLHRPRFGPSTGRSVVTGRGE